MITPLNIGLTIQMRNRPYKLILINETSIKSYSTVTSQVPIRILKLSIVQPEKSLNFIIDSWQDFSSSYLLKRFSAEISIAKHEIYFNCSYRMTSTALN
ncbi:hypothetical protein D3C76_972010 [compost metagenome]